jgi:uncharacterized protein YceK
MKNILLTIISLLLLSGCSNKVIQPAKVVESKIASKATSSLPILTYSDDNFKIYSFNAGDNALDLNFDGVDDYVFVSHITGADYYDYHTNANMDIYNFFINYANPDLPNSWNMVTKEIPNKKIINFDKDFTTTELMGCNGGSVLRIAQTKNETFLIAAKENRGEKDGANTRVLFSIYKLKTSGNLKGSDYIFSLVKDVVGESRGCYIKELTDKDIVGALQKIMNPSYNQIMNSKSEPDKSPDLYKTKYDGKVVEWKAKISTYYPQITGIKFCIVDNEHQNVDIDKPCDWFWAFSTSIMDADDVAVNPSWDGKWVDYVLKHYKVSFDKDKRFYNDVYTITGAVNGLDCGVDSKCIPNIEIISITK